jgi:hypothetical protein
MGFVVGKKVTVIKKSKNIQIALVEKIQNQQYSSFKIKQRIS